MVYSCRAGIQGGNLGLPHGCVYSCTCIGDIPISLSVVMIFRKNIQVTHWRLQDSNLGGTNVYGGWDTIIFVTI